MSATNEERFRRLIQAANEEDLEGALALISEEVVWIAARSVVQGVYHGHDGIRSFFADNEESFERFEPVADEIRDLGDRLVVIGSIHVRGRGSGVDTVVPMAGIAAYRDGKLVRWEDYRERDRALEAAKSGAESPACVELVQVRPEAAAAILEGAPPPAMTVAIGYPTEFSRGVAESVGGDQTVGPFFIRRGGDGLIVGELGGAFVDESTIEIGYAVVESAEGRGYATAAVREFLRIARSDTDATLVVAHTPPDRPASGRVLTKAGFASRGRVEDDHEGQPITVEEWGFALAPS